MGLDIGTYNGIPGECYNKILNATLPDSEDAFALDWITDDTGLTAEEIRMKLSTWKKTMWNGEEWYYDPDCNNNCFDYNDWQDGITLFGEDLGIECSFDFVEIITSTQDFCGL